MVKKLVFSLPLILALTACGGGSSDDNNSSTSGSNMGNQNGNIQCNKGIPSGMSALNKGLFDQTLYSMSIEYSASNNESLPSNQLFEDKTELIKNVIYMQTFPVSQPNGDINHQEDNKFDYLLNKHGLFTTKSYQETQHGWPIAYISKMNENYISLNGFNDQCDLSIDSSDHQYQVIDLSGQPIATFFEDDGTSTLIAGDSDFPQKNYKYIDSQVINFLNPSHPWSAQESQRQQNFKNMLRANAKFPTGSYAYVMTQVKQHDTTYAFDEEPTELSRLEDWAKHYPSTVQWKKLSIAGYTVYQAYKADGRFDCVKDPAILKDGKIYDGECSAADQTVEDFKTDRTFYINQIARDTIRTQLKQHYQY